MKVVEQYNPEWQNWFETISSYIKPVMGEFCIRFEHVGSTSVPGMVAKPIIDFDVIIESNTFGLAKSALETIGYLHEGDKGLKGREAFDYIDTTHPLPKHHLYVCEMDNYYLKQHLSFRNFLRKYPDYVKKLSDFKLKLARDANQNRKEYQKRKDTSEFVRELANLAFTES